MDVGIFSYSQGDPLLIDKIVNEFLSQGKFDKLRKECMSDADTKPAYQNLQQRVENTVTQFLKKQIWKPDVNKNQLRDSLKKHVLESNFFDAGINRIVDQVVNPNVLATVFLPEVEEVVYNYLSIPKPPDKTQKKVDEAKEVIQKVKNEVNEITQSKDLSFHIKKENFEEGSKLENLNENIKRTNEGLKLQNVKPEEKIDNETKVTGEQTKNTSVTPYRNIEKLEFPFTDESQEFFSKLAVEKLQISESTLVCPPDPGDSSYVFEVIEKSTSESRDSEDSIMNQMSPISQGRLTPDISEDDNVDEKKKKKQNEEKKLLSFTGRIPKLKREDSEFSKCLKKEVIKTEKSDLKIIYSSDESDSSKSFEKNDYEGRNSKDKKSFLNKQYMSNTGNWKSNCEKKVKDKERLKTSKNKKRLSSIDKEKKKGKNESKSYKPIKNFPSFSGEKSHHKSSCLSQHKYSEFKENLDDKKKKEQKKKNKSSDDHEKEKNKKNDRRSTDRDSNERDKSSGSRSQSDGRKKEKEQKTEDNKSEKSHKEEAEMESEIQSRSESNGVVLDVEEGSVSKGEVVLVNEEWICSEILQENEYELQSNNKIKIKAAGNSEHIVEEDESLNFEELVQAGELALIRFSEPTNDFYVKFNSTGFKYFEEWEKCKLDCEEEFKEFVDEAENNLTLISDDDSEFEDLNFDQKNQNVIDNLLNGVSNYKKGLIFNPLTSEFYKWTNSKYYHKFRKKFEKKCWKNSQKNESDESIKENINRINNKKTQNFVFSRERSKESQVKDEKCLHLKLLNKYKRKALRQGRHKRKYKRKTLKENSKEKKLNSNDSTLILQNDFFIKAEVEEKREIKNSYFQFSHSNLMTSSIKTKDKIHYNLNTVQSLPENSDSFNCVIEKGKKMPLENTSVLNNSKPENKKFVNNFGRYDCNLFKIDEDGLGRSDGGGMKTISVDSTQSLRNFESQKKKKRMRLNTEKRKLNNQICLQKEININNSTILPHKCNLPLSPESDYWSPERSGATETDDTGEKSMKFENVEQREVPRKKSRRSNCQKYENQDLYKPRLILNSSRTRGRGDQGLGNNTLCNSLISISSGDK